MRKSIYTRHSASQHLAERAEVELVDGQIRLLMWRGSGYAVYELTTPAAWSLAEALVTIATLQNQGWKE